MGLAQLEWNSTFCTVERGGCGCFWSQSVSGSWTESHLCFVAHLHLQKAAWVGMLIRCVHLRTNPLEYYDNIWQTSSPEWQAWPTASEHYCLSRKHRSFDVLHTTDLPTKYPVEGSWVLYLPSNIIQLLAWRARFWMCSESFHNIRLFFFLNHEWRIYMFHWDLVTTCFTKKSANIHWRSSMWRILDHT